MSPPLMGPIQQIVAQFKTSFSGFDWYKALKQAEDGVDPSKALQSIVVALVYLEGNNAENFLIASKFLADGSRDEAWRLPYGESGVLDFYLDLLARDRDNHLWTTDALRLVANCCIDESDVNRERVLAKNGVSSLLDHFPSEHSSGDFAIVALSNLCNDFEPAKEAARKQRLFPKLIDLFRPAIDVKIDHVDDICLLLDFAVEDQDQENHPDDAIQMIYNYLVNASLRNPPDSDVRTHPGSDQTASSNSDREFILDIDHELTLLSSISTLLGEQHYRQLTVARDEVGNVAALLIYSYTHNIASLISPYPEAGASIEHRVHESHEAVLDEKRSSLAKILFQMSELPEFFERYDFQSGLVRMLASWLSLPQPQLQRCACTMFFNLATTPVTIANLVDHLSLDRALVKIMDESNDTQLIVETLRLYSNLALNPDQSRLSDNHVMDVVSLLWFKHESRVVHYNAVYLLGQLLHDQYDTTKRFVTYRPRQRGYHSYSTNIARLMYLYQIPANDLGIRVEVAKLVGTIFRMGRQQVEVSGTVEPLWVDDAVYQARETGPNIAAPIVSMISDSNNASLKTQGWLTLTLIARYPLGCDAVYDVLCTNADHSDMLETTVKNRSVEAKFDRENASSLLWTMREYYSDKNDTKVAFLSDMLQEAKSLDDHPTLAITDL